MTPLLDVADLVVRLPGPRAHVDVLDHVDFGVSRGRTTGLIGESGSGKTMTALAVIGLLPDGATALGRIGYDGENTLELDATRRRRLRGREMAMVFQDPLAALNPVLTVGRQVGEILRRDGRSRAAARKAAVELLERVEIPQAASRVDDYPHQFSGGMRQRAMIALALAGQPRLLLADEPTTALDVTVQSRILDLLRRLRDAEHMAMLLVSHDLRVMAHTADTLVVMYAGRVCETGPAGEVLRRPAHPYTRALIRNVPTVRVKTPLTDPLPGTPAGPFTRPGGCAFRTRCPMARERCREQVPRPRPVAKERTSACHYAEELV
ncbi:ABC transporter ATP-binding protein [Streptomyces sp. NPDC004629]|uniref:ABC transporter ATP-binding protein n=1 Tax=Streptomyces sp. NPDC004629 TaxID=3364705 RepID=UPI0036C9F6D3